MTAGNNGTPEPDDDPFGYLYHKEGDEQPATQAADRPGVPRTSYHQVSRVGERRSPQGGYGYPPQQPSYAQQSPQGQSGYGQQQPGYGQQQQYQQQSHGPAETQQQRSGHGGHGGHGSGGRGSSSGNRGLMLGAIAVVVVVAVGIVIAVVTGDNDGDNRADDRPTTQPTVTQSQQPTGTASADPNANLPQQFAANMTLTGGASTNTNHKGGKGPNGVFVDGMSTPGATAAWAATVPKAGTYTLWVRYANAQPDDAKTTVVVNGKPLAWKMNLKDYGTPGDWDQWFTSFVTVDLKEGANTVALTCGTGDVCHYNLDRLGLTVDKEGRPTGW